MKTSLLRMSAARAAFRYLSCLRPLEIVALQGSPILGFVLAIHQPTIQSAGQLVLLVAANVFLVAHIFLTNDWADLKRDLADPNTVKRVFTARGVSRNEIAGLMIVLLGLSLLLLDRKSTRLNSSH